MASRSRRAGRRLLEPDQRDLGGGIGHDERHMTRPSDRVERSRHGRRDRRRIDDIGSRERGDNDAGGSGSEACATIDAGRPPPRRRAATRVDGDIHGDDAGEAA